MEIVETRHAIPDRIVRLDFPNALVDRHFDFLTLAVESLGRVLIAQQAACSSKRSPKAFQFAPKLLFERFPADRFRGEEFLGRIFKGEHFPVAAREPEVTLLVPL